jgi:hypothetical protein
MAKSEDEVDETSVQRLLLARHNRSGPALAVGDLNDDGHDDVIVSGTTRDPASAFIANAAGTFLSAPTSAFNSPSPVNDGPVLVFDADGDGHCDLLATRGGASQLAGAPEYQPKLFLGDGRGSFRAAPDGALPSLPISVGAATAADFNHDGRLDVFIGGRLSPGDFPNAPQSALLANRGGNFEDVTDSMAPALRNVGMVTSALWSDVDGDGWIDLLLTIDWGGVRYFHNNQGNGFDDRSEHAGFASAGSGWWTSIATADFNGDGRPDYVVGNVGLNTRYRADRAHPALLFVGDFKGDGSSQLVEGYYEGDKVYPWLSRRELSAVIPAIAKRFPRNDAYARATLGEILGADKLARAERFAATELRSGVFLSLEKGNYRFEPLPRFAQVAPAQGIVAGDFDGDGHADIYLVENSFAPVPSIGRFDGGLSLMLRGGGRGHFSPVTPAESNLVVPGDAKALAVLDFNGDGWPDFLVTRNNSTALAFRNQGVAGRHMFSVRLQSRPGNATAAGAQVVLTLSDGSVQSVEVGAGSGYQSQSSAACFFGYTDAAAPKSIRVRWPWGESTEHAVPASPGNLTLSAPK